MKTSTRFLRFGLLISVCAQLGCMAALRKGPLDEIEESPPTSGGRWAERGFLSQDMGEAGMMGNGSGPYFEERYRMERGLASVNPDGNSGTSWISGESEQARARGMQIVGQDGEPIYLNSGEVANLEPTVRRMYKGGDRATRADFVDDTPNEGSLWGSNGQTNYYFSKNKVRSVGDIVTINMEGDLVKDMGLEVRRHLSPREKEKEMQLAEDRVRARLLAAESSKKSATGTNPQSPTSAPLAPGAEAKAAAADEAPVSNEVSLSDIDVGRSLEVKTGDTMMGEIVERYPNGNYKIRGTKKVPYKNGAPRLMQLTGVARGTDISEDDVVNSGKLYEYRLEAAR